MRGRVAILVGLLVLQLTACGGAATPATPDSTPTPAAPAPSPTVAGSVPSEGASCPDSHPIKGNITSTNRIYYLPDLLSYGRIQPEACFASPTDAEAAGFRRAER